MSNLSFLAGYLSAQYALDGDILAGHITSPRSACDCVLLYTDHKHYVRKSKKPAYGRLTK